MAKRQKQWAKGERNSMVKQENGSTDRMSILPDELLVSILSLLPLKDAAATSILSHRWRYLWTLLPKLDFDSTELFLKLKNGRSSLVVKRWKYVKWVDDVMSALQQRRESIEEFRVFFNLTRADTSRIHRWLQHAVADNKGKIRKLELNLVNYFAYRSREYDECYTFPYELLSSGNNNFELLKSLSLHYVNVNGEALELLLRKSRHLEELYVSQSGHLSALKIISPFPSFKRLEISLCHNLNSLEIRDAKIVYLKYKGSRICHFVMENVPLLVELCIGGALTEDMCDLLAMFRSYLAQLEIFKIDFMLRSFSWEETAEFCSKVTMNNLKQLVVARWVGEGVSLLPLTNFIRASPCLQKFVLEASHWHSDLTSMRWRTETMTMRQPYHRLKVVELVGYRGAICELELITHFVKNAVALKQIRVDPRYPSDELYKWILTRNIEDEVSARARAKDQLTEIVPSNINLNIL